MVHMLRPVKQGLDLKVHNMYQIPCERSKVYMGQTEKYIEAKYKKHKKHIHLDQSEKSTVAEHNKKTRHSINSKST
ncbi:hypothetical protein Cfor_02305 [Coptotermes formosanus]|uniref:Uncharacterized protein n=1 Tax=Coptotermes formosanus TaxID=36987 RepID=A0A6L2PEK3_COPFO|nr:hypothetical protein Cfor_02305 [Coptotermes formosanus]